MANFDVTQMVTDRTLEDVKAKNDKGCYNATDLNRASEAIIYLRSKLIELGYKSSRGTDRLKTNWQMTDFPTQTYMQEYVICMRYLNTQLVKASSYAFNKFQYWTHEDANEFEKMIVQLNTYIENLEKNTDLGWAMGMANLGLYSSI